MPLIRLLTISIAISTQCLAQTDNHDQMLELHGRARVSIGVNVSDGAINPTE